METEGTSLDDILNGTEPEAVATPEPEQQAAEPQPEPDNGQPRGPDGKFLPKETGVEQPQAAAPAAEPVPPTGQQGLPPEEFKALKEERRKRQELERQIADMQQQFAARQQAPSEQVPEFWENPDAAMQARLEQFGSTLMQRWQQQQQAERIDASEQQARSKYADYDDAFHAFRQAVQANPMLAQEMARSNDPAEYAYRKGRTALELERVGSIDELLKAERQKWEAEARQAVQPAPAMSFPSSTVTERSVGGRTGPAWAGPTPLNDILS